MEFDKLSDDELSAIRLDQLTEPELRALNAEWRRRAAARFEHADELERYVARRHLKMVE